MAIISTFLCWPNTRTGSVACGSYSLIISVLCLAFSMMRDIAFSDLKESIELQGIVYAGYVLYPFLIGVSFVLLLGVYRDRKFWLLPWIYIIVMTVLYEAGAVAMTTAVHYEKHSSLGAWDIVAVFFYFARLIANCYCFVCVVSQYQELSEGRGTFEFLFKPHRRHMTRDTNLSDCEEYSPPYGATLPPYSEENPYKEYSPPNYENLDQGLQDFGAVVTPCRREVSVRVGSGGTYPSYIHLSGVNSGISRCDSDTDSYSERNSHCDSYSERNSHCDSYNERNSHCDDSEANISHSSFDTSSDQNNDYPNSPDLARVSDNNPPQIPSHQHCLHNKHLKTINIADEDAVAMTCSSACLMQYPFDKSFTSGQKSAKSKQSQESPTSLQNRTHFIWI